MRMIGAQLSSDPVRVEDSASTGSELCLAFLSQGAHRDSRFAASRRQLRELPIQLRGSPAALIGLQPGAVGTNSGVTGTGLNSNRLGSVTGSRADQGNITVDGIDANDVTTGQAFATVANAPMPTAARTIHE